MEMDPFDTDVAEATERIIGNVGSRLPTVTREVEWHRCANRQVVMRTKPLKLRIGWECLGCGAFWGWFRLTEAKARRLGDIPEGLFVVEGDPYARE